MFHTKYARHFYAKLFLNDLSPGMINYFARQLANVSNYRWDAPGERESALEKNRLLAEDVLLLEGHIDTLLPVCVPEHYASGLVFLRNLAYTPKGVRRATVNSDKFYQSDLDVLAAPLRIRLLGFREYNAGGGRYHSAFLAQYRVESAHGFFTYEMRPWQSGAYFDILDRGEELP